LSLKSAMSRITLISTILIILSAILITGITAINLSYAGQGTQSKVISGPAAAILTFWCNPPASTEGCFDLRTIDLDYDDGVDDTQIYSRHVISEVTGILEGNHIMHQTVKVDLTTNVQYGQFTSIFTGTVGESESGSMMITGAFTTDRSEFPLITWESNLQTVEGSATGDLTGVCGGGNYQGSGGGGTPFTSTSNYEFRFGDACNGNI
jgi:hypothetical protein